MKTAQSFKTTYLGFDLIVSETSVEVRRHGRYLGSVPSVKQARLFVRGYRREERRQEVTV